MVLPPPQPISRIAASLSIETCFNPQSVNLECRRFIPRRFHRPSQPVGFRSWFSNLLARLMLMLSSIDTKPGGTRVTPAFPAIVGHLGPELRVTVKNSTGSLLGRA